MPHWRDYLFPAQFIDDVYYDMFAHARKAIPINPANDLSVIVILKFTVFEMSRVARLIRRFFYKEFALGELVVSKSLRPSAFN